jgi:DNA-binding MarR family transcriptional regulator
MGTVIRQRLKQSAPFDSPSDEAMLNIMVTADYLRARFDGVFSDHGITQSQYNILRILRGAYPEGHPRGEIACRMIERAPDCTRLIDGLENRQLVERVRVPEDRRLSIARITKKGLALLDDVQPKITAFQREILQKISLEECLALSHICEKIYGNDLLT